MHCPFLLLPTLFSAELQRTHGGGFAKALMKSGVPVFILSG